MARTPRGRQLNDEDRVPSDIRSHQYDADRATLKWKRNATQAGNAAIVAWQARKGALLW